MVAWGAGLAEVAAVLSLASWQGCLCHPRSSEVRGWQGGLVKGAG